MWHKIYEDKKVGTFNGIPFWSVNEMIVYTAAKKQQRILDRIFDMMFTATVGFVVWYFL